MKKCNKCNVPKELEEFPIRKGSKDGRGYTCLDCTSERSRQHYNNNKKEYKDRARKKTKELVKRNQEYVLYYLQTHPCIDCGENDPVVLEFDHQADKKTEVTLLVLSGATLEKIQEEIDKCEVRCANCHRRKTAKQRGYYRYLNGGLV